MAVIAKAVTATNSSPSWLALVDRLVAACPAPALVVEREGAIRLANDPARRALERRLGLRLEGLAVRAVLGLGWLELAMAGQEGDADLVVDLPAGAGSSRSRGWRLRPEPVLWDGEVGALVVYLEPPVEGLVPAPRKTRSEGFGAIFGHDPALRATKDAAERFARTRLPILVLAETGTGKELLARAIHLASPRRERAFVAINCGALSPHLLESELFGYAPGAFTGANREGSEGKIGAARGGTLFLDEVAEMPGPLQALLLRVLEDGTYYRVGDSVARHADIRLICATCRDLPRMVEEGAFRQDLFYRIDGACLTLPPLRERSDLPELTHHLLSRLVEEDPELEPTRIESSAFAWLIRQPWPGNVRQLKTALQHALVLANGAEIRREHLPVLVDGLPRFLAARGSQERPPAPEPTPLPVPGATPGSAQGSAMPSGEGPSDGSAAETLSAAPATLSATRLAELEAELVRRAVAEAEGNLSLAARRLGIARTTLYRRLRAESAK